jgi:hypothetical protein
MSDSESPDDTERWRHLLWSYLAAVHDMDPAAVAPFAELQARVGGAGRRMDV